MRKSLFKNVNRAVRIVYLMALLPFALFLSCGESVSTGDVTFNVFFSDTNADWNNMKDEVGVYLEEKTGVTVAAEFPVGELSQKISLIIASGEYPDMIMPKGDAGALVEAGAMIDLEPLIEKHAPNIKKVMGNQFDRLRYSLNDPKIYFIPTIEYVGQIEFDMDAFFKLQLRALKEAGYPKVVTLKDYESVIEQYVNKHPVNENGQPAIGLSLLADDWRFVISTTNPAFFAAGYSDDGEWGIDPVSYEAKPHYFRPEEREYFRWLNHMNHKGLLDPESFIQKYDQYIAKIASGRVVGVVDAWWEIQDAVNALKAEGKFEQTYGRFGAVIKEGIKPAWNTPTGFRGGWGIGITTACKDPVRAIKFLDYLSSDEGQVLINWGIEGKHYNVVDGKRVIPEDVAAMKYNDQSTFKKTTGIGNYFMSVRYGDGVKDPGGNYYTTKFPDSILDEYSSADKEALKAYGVNFWGDLLPPASEFEPKPWAAFWSIPVPQDKAEMNDFWNLEQAVVKKYLPKAIMGAPSDFDASYDAMLAELDKEVGHLYESATELVKDRLKLWGYIK
ncbi:MAG: ABC transporter substrate-binding protein [Spirochaetales bacterium]|nr:ABC transporter substrate-binding protein [Spirochaetales bacterium]